MPIIKITTTVKADRRIVFDLSRSIDLHQISTAATNEKAVAGVTSGLIGMGEWVTWRAKHFGVYQKLTSKITAFDRPIFFVDEMQKGAFKGFKHQHIFNEVAEGTEMIDIFDYESPLGFVGRWADKLFLEKYMTKLLAHRNQIIKEFGESDQWQQILKY